MTEIKRIYQLKVGERFRHRIDGPWYLATKVTLVEGREIVVRTDPSAEMIYPDGHELIEVAIPGDQDAPSLHVRKFDDTDDEMMTYFINNPAGGTLMIGFTTKGEIYRRDCPDNGPLGSWVKLVPAESDG